MKEEEMETEVIRQPRLAWLALLSSALGACTASTSAPSSDSDIGKAGAAGKPATEKTSSGGGGGWPQSTHDGGSQSGGTGGCEVKATNACNGTDSECADGNPCTQDVCQSQGEFFKCTNEPIANCDGDPTAPVDSNCGESGLFGMQAVTIPFVPLKTPNLPASCSAGFEWQNCSATYEVGVPGECGTDESRTLYLDIATYTAGDRLRLTGVGADGQEYVLLDTCRIRTASYFDPTDGKTRPPDDSIRQFEVVVKAGTKSLKFDSTMTSTPWYMRVLGMCDFELPPLAGQCAWRTASL